MENQNPIKPPHKTNWMVIILLIVIVAIVAFVIWWWQKDTAKIAELEQRIVPTEQDNRILITAETVRDVCLNKIQEGQDCSYSSWNNDAPTTTVTYQNKSQGFQVDLPWNPKWGNDKYRISPYEEGNTHGLSPVVLYIGPMFPGRFGIERSTWQFGLGAAQTAEQVMADCQKANILPPQKVTIDGREAVKCANGDDLGNAYTITIIKPGHDYYFAYMDYAKNADHEAQMKKVEDFAKTLKLVPIDEHNVL